MDDKIKRMKELIPILSEAAKAYYQESREIMSNFEYDRLYDELLKLEQETGTVFAGSPTQKVGYEVLSELPKERHERPTSFGNGSADRKDFCPGRWTG